MMVVLVLPTVPYGDGSIAACPCLPWMTEVYDRREDAFATIMNSMGIDPLGFRQPEFLSSFWRRSIP